MTRPQLWRAARIAIGVTVLGLVLWRVDWAEFGQVTGRLRPVWLALVAVVVTVDRLWMAGKWHLLLRGLGVRVSFIETVTTYYIGVLVGLAAQWQLGGDIARALRLGHYSGEHRRVTVSVVFEKLAGFAACGILAAIALSLLHAQYPVVPGGIALGTIVVAVVVLAATPLVLLGPVGSRLLARLARASPRLAVLRTDLSREERDGLRRIALVFFLLTLGEQLMPIVSNSLVQRSLGLDVGLRATFAVVPIIAFVSRLPVSVEAIGVYEGMTALLFGLIGLSTAEALALAITARVTGLTVTAAGAGVCLALRRRATRLGVEAGSA
ncbi:MAG TPA: lysylphosphatidylglycerol synthase transmembrane domain-containing protein [Gemmatimonadales bacterium]|nr:lysylphosphatidylglycerol synthase transmembrane domain-containing protein [Gemmatimonadales bacterium]